MDSKYQELMPPEPADQDRVKTTFFILSLLIHLIALLWFLSAGFRHHNHLQPQTDLAKQLRLATLHGKPCKVYFDSRPSAPLSSGLATAPASVNQAPQASVQPKPKVIKKERVRPKIPKHVVQPKPALAPIPTPALGIPKPVHAQVSDDKPQSPSAYNPVTDKPIITPFKASSTDATLTQGGQAIVGNSNTGSSEEAQATHNTCRNIIPMTKGFVERADLDELEDNDYSDGQGQDETTNAGADQSAYAIEFTLYRTKVSSRFLSAWYQHFSHLPIKKRFQIRQHLIFHDAVVSYTLNRGGRLIACNIVESTGDPEIDRRIVKSFELSIFPPFPKHFAQQTFTFVEQIRASHLDGSEEFLELVRC